MNNPSSDDFTRWTQMRKEMMDSLRAELLQNDLQSRVTQLEDKVAQLEGAERENSELKQRCDTLHHTNSMLLKRQLRGEDQIFSLQEEIESLRFSLHKAEKKSNYLQAVSSNQQWQYPVAVPTMVELLSLKIPPRCMRRYYKSYFIYEGYHYKVENGKRNGSCQSW